jgi:hypothetical protein
VRFKDFLREGDAETAADFLAAIERLCAPFIHELPHPLHPDILLFRGMTGLVGDFSMLDANKSRRPKDTERQFHDAADDWFFDNFGWHARSEGVFCTGSKAQAKVYGPTIYAILPVGPRYEYIWSPKIKDMYQQTGTAKHIAKQALGLNATDEEVMDESLEILNMVLKSGNYQDRDLEAAIMSHNEVMLRCDRYVAIKHEGDLWQYFVDWLKVTKL